MSGKKELPKRLGYRCRKFGLDIHITKDDNLITAKVSDAVPEKGIRTGLIPNFKIRKIHAQGKSICHKDDQFSLGYGATLAIHRAIVSYIAARKHNLMRELSTLGSFYADYQNSNLTKRLKLATERGKERVS